MTSAGFRSIKAEHFKKRGDEAVKLGNCRDAWELYSQAIKAEPDRELMSRVLSNRALAYSKGGRHADALADAQQAATLAPTWDKPWWRQGSALLGLQRTPEAIAAFVKAWKVSQGSEECGKMMWAVLQKLTRQELAEGMLRHLSHLESQGKVGPAELEECSTDQMLEAGIMHLKRQHNGAVRSSPHLLMYSRWLKQDADPAEAYSERAAIFCYGKCFLQGRADARQAVHLFKTKLQAEMPPTLVTRQALAEAYQRLGDAFLAEKDHPDTDYTHGLKAFRQGLSLHADNGRLQQGVEAASPHVTTFQIEQIELEIQAEDMDTVGLPSTAESAALHGSMPPIIADAILSFPEAKQTGLSGRPREMLKAGLAAAAGLPQHAIMLEGVQRQASGRGLQLRFSLTIAAPSAAEDVIRSLKAGAGAALKDADLIALLGPLHSTSIKVSLPGARVQRNVTSGTAAAEECMGESRSHEAADTTADGGAAAKQLTRPTQPKTDLELPYKMYRLVRADGKAVERPNKHPFCMSRVYYDATEKPEEVWTEVADGSCRWRQSGSEIKVICLKVPAELTGAQLHVQIEPYRVRVARKGCEEVFFEGELERGIVPRESIWEAGQGRAEDGFMLHLHKMNLELLRQHWAHSEMWWPRLLRHHSPIAWDDYEKDYSDLPAPVMQRHKAAEALKDADRQLENSEKSVRDILQERDDIRKRTRQERLHEMRTGAKASWVSIDRRWGADGALVSAAPVQTSAA
ncbi:hypothetical protein WJX84_007801 [Apatococcus fuscideae]|uniref:CS domain-containing protein n=1 Tax=Apatococcus fuscideae TaxID=2026836 RepID=A0AAW1T9B4_9CHLO